MKMRNVSAVIAATILMAACGADEQSTADVAAENPVAGQPGELGTVEGSFDVAGETNSGADAAVEGNAQVVE